MGIEAVNSRIADIQSRMIAMQTQQAAATNAGSAPISDAVRAKVQPAVDAIAAN